MLEPEVMDTADDAREYDAIDNDAVNEEFARRAAALAPPRGTVLDLGTGPGRIAVLLAARAPGLRVVAIDLAEHMLAIARAHVAAAGLADRVQIVRADAKATGFPDGSFDMVISNSTVHHIPDPEQLFREVARVARPGAALFVKDLVRPRDLGEWRALVELHAGGANERQRQLFADSLRAALSVDEVGELCARAGLRGPSIARCSDRHWSLERGASR
jgi:ubiquinone/menaquinone biosynthesis C-methylase UbiE